MKKATYRTAVWMLLLAIGVLGAGTSRPARAVTPWVTGDVFAGVGNGRYQVYDNAGVFKETISDGLGGLTTGCSFNTSLTRLYTTNFSNTRVVVYDDPSPHPVSQIIDTRLMSPRGSSESVVFDAAGSFYVGHADGNRRLHKYDAAGNLLMTFSPATEDRGTDWNDLAADQRTMFYTSEGSLIKRFDVGGNVQLPDFASIGSTSYALRLLLPADGCGGLIVANTESIKRLDGSGTVVQTYDVPGEDFWFAINLDPNRASFWAGGIASSNFYRFNLATGAIEVGPINTGTGSRTLGGLCIKGEIAPSLTPEAQPARPQVVCGGRCNVSITCNLPAVVGAPCTNQVDVFVRRPRPRRSGTSGDLDPLRDGSSAKAPRRMIRFAFGVANVPPGQTAPVRLKLTPRGKKIARSGAKRLTGILEIRNVAGPAIGRTSVRIRIRLKLARIATTRPELGRVAAASPIETYHTGKTAPLNPDIGSVACAVRSGGLNYGREAGGRLAVDFDGDGRRDLVRSVADALGSTANYLKRSGWQPGDPWTIEVMVPRGYDGPREQIIPVELGATQRPACRRGAAVSRRPCGV